MRAASDEQPASSHQQPATSHQSKNSIRIGRWEIVALLLAGPLNIILAVIWAFAGFAAPEVIYGKAIHEWGMYWLLGPLLIGPAFLGPIIALAGGGGLVLLFWFVFARIGRKPLILLAPFALMAWHLLTLVLVVVGVVAYYDLR